MTSDQSRVVFHAGFRLGIEQCSNRRQFRRRVFVPDFGTEFARQSAPISVLCVIAMVEDIELISPNPITKRSHTPDTLQVRLSS